MACRYIEQCSRSIGIATAYNLWLSVGGKDEDAVEAVAIALAESCLDPQAQSEACAAGVWQIFVDHATERRIPYEALFDVRTNAGIAVELAATALHWGHWDVAYAAGESLTHRYYIAHPEPYSSAWYQIIAVQQELGIGGSGGGQTFAPIASQPVQPPGLDLPPGTSTLPPQYFPTVVPIGLLGNAELRDDGFDNTREYYNDTIPKLLEYDNYLLRNLIR